MYGKLSKGNTLTEENVNYHLPPAAQKEQMLLLIFHLLSVSKDLFKYKKLFIIHYKEEEN